MVSFAHVGHIETSEWNWDCFITSQKLLVQLINSWLSLSLFLSFVVLNVFIVLYSIYHSYSLYLFLIPLMWWLLIVLHCFYSLIHFHFLIFLNNVLIVIYLFFLLSRFVFCDFACFINLIPFTCHDSYWLVVFSHFLFCSLVWTHLRLDFFVFGLTGDCLFSNIVFPELLFTIVPHCGTQRK